MKNWQENLSGVTEGVQCQHAASKEMEAAARALRRMGDTRRIVIRRLAYLAASHFCIGLSSAQPLSGEDALADLRPVTAEDLAFLKAEGRLRRIKQAVSTDGIRTAGEAKVLAMAIDGVIIFGIGLPVGLDPRSPGRRHVTEHGLKVLILPPPLQHDPSERHHVSHWSKWDVRSPAELAVTADFGDVRGWPPPVLSQRMVFILDAGVWKFDRYEQ